MACLPPLSLFLSMKWSSPLRSNSCVFFWFWRNLTLDFFWMTLDYSFWILDSFWIILSGLFFLDYRSASAILSRFRTFSFLYLNLCTGTCVPCPFFGDSWISISCPVRVREYNIIYLLKLPILVIIYECESVRTGVRVLVLVYEYIVQVK